MPSVPNSDLPSSTKLYGLCTRCAEQSTFTIEREDILRYSEWTIGGVPPPPDEKMVILICTQCQGKIVVVEQWGRPQFPVPPVEEDVSDEIARTTPQVQNTKVLWWGVQWWPRPD